MGGDLPDYTRMIAVNVDIPEIEVGPVNVGIYYSAPADLPDGTRTPILTDVKGRLIVVQHEKDRTITSGVVTVSGTINVGQLEKDRTVETLTGKFVRVKGHATDEVPVTLTDQKIIPRPKGGALEKGSATTTSSYATVASRVVTNGKQFQLSKILISAEKAAWIKYRWNSATISAERLIDDRAVLIEHFPYDYKEMIGDGAKAFDVQAKYYSAAGIVNVEIVGEEV